MANIAVLLWSLLVYPTLQLVPSTTVHVVLDVVGWDNLLLICDIEATECAADAVLSVRPAVYNSVDLRNSSDIVQTFETHAAPRQLNWLVFCAHCETLLDEINSFELTHELHGHLTYRYQWILIPNSYILYDKLVDRLGTIRNLLILNEYTIYTAMFGTTRYLQKVSYSTRILLPKKHLFPNLLTGLNNISLTFTVMPWNPYVIKDGSGAYSGYYIELMQIMAAELNFTFRITEPLDRQYGSLRNDTWTGMIGQLVNKEADMAAVLLVSRERGLYVTQMTVPVRVGYELVIYHKPEPMAMSVELLIKPFNQNIWISITGVLILTMAIFHCTQADYEISIKRLVQKDHGAYVLRSSLNQGSTWVPKKPSGRVIYCFYSLSWIIIVSTYTAYLVSFLSVKKENIPFRTMKELSDNNDYKLGTIGGSAMYDMIHRVNFSSANPLSYLKTKLLRDATTDPSVIDADIQKHRKRLYTDNYAFLTNSETFAVYAAESCKVAALEEKGERMSAGFALQKNSAYARDFDMVLARIHEGQLDRKLKQKYLLKPKQCTTSHDIVRLEDSQGVFFILLAGLGLALVVFCVEFFCSSKVWLDMVDLSCYICVVMKRILLNKPID